MSTMNYAFNPDGSRTATTTAQAMGGGQPSQYEQFMAQLLERNARWQEEDRNRAMYYANRPSAAMGARGSGPTRPSTGSTAAGGHGPAPSSQLEFEKQLAERAKLQALMSPAPTRMTTFASGANNGYTLDTNNMTGIQRQLYLPQSSTPAPGGADTLEDRKKAGASNAWDYELQRRYEEFRQRGY